MGGRRPTLRVCWAYRGYQESLGRGTRVPQYNLKQLLQQVIQHLEKRLQALEEAVPGDTMDFLAETSFSALFPETGCTRRKEGEAWGGGEDAPLSLQDTRPRSGSGDCAQQPWSSCVTHVLSGQWTEGGGERRSYKRAPHTLSRFNHRTSASALHHQALCSGVVLEILTTVGPQLTGTELWFFASASVTTVPGTWLALRMCLLKFYWLRLKLWCWAVPAGSPGHPTPAHHPGQLQS